MSYFVKKTNNKKGLYIQIYLGDYDPDVGNTVQKSYKSIGYYDALVAAGDPDPIASAQKTVDELNRKRKLEKIKAKANVPKISRETSLLKNVGYFPLKMVMNELKVENVIRFLQKATRDFDFDIFEVMSSLVYARVVNPDSKRYTYQNVFPKMYNCPDVSYDQILECCEHLGGEYQKFIELFTEATKNRYGIDTRNTYFDCTNFYFEIDREDDFRKKGPSKENKKDPIVGLGLLLDANMIPIGMKMYPGNQSEKPVLREIVKDLKSRNHIEGKTIHVADKGLNCADNIYKALLDKDGYLFSKSVKQLSKVEKVWVFNDNDWVDVKDKSGKVLYRYKECIDKFPYTITGEDGNDVVVHLREKRVLTFNPKLCEKQKYEIHKLVEKAKANCLSKAKKDEFGECGKYVDFVSEDKKKVTAKVNQDKIDSDLAVCGYNLIVTSETNLEPLEVYSVYHNLWRIEESFKVMKSDLDSRPVFLHKEDSIKGHFLICYIAVLLIRLLQFKVLNNALATEQITEFIRTFIAAECNANGKLMNMSRRTDTFDVIEDILDIPVNNLYLDKTILKAMQLE